MFRCNYFALPCLVYMTEITYITCTIQEIPSVYVYLPFVFSIVISNRSCVSPLCFGLHFAVLRPMHGEGSSV